MRLDEIPASVRDVLLDAKSRLRARFGDRLLDVRLFGSHARGTARPDSDIDVLVVLDRLEGSLDLIEATDLVAAAGVDHDRLAEALVMGGAQLDRQRRWETALARALDADGVAV